MTGSGGEAPSMWRGRLWRFSRRSGVTPGANVSGSFQRVMQGALVAHEPSRRTRRVGAATTSFMQASHESLIECLADAFLSGHGR